MSNRIRKTALGVSRAWLGHTALLAGMLAAAGPAWGQLPLIGGAQGVGAAGLQGPQLYSVYGSASYNSYSLSGSGLTVAPQNGLSSQSALKANDALGMFGTAVGWVAPGTKTNFAVIYSPSYFGSMRNPDANSLNHSLQLSSGTPRKLSRKWTMDIGLSANLLTFNAFMLTPNGLSGVAFTGSNTGDLANAIIRRDMANDRLASSLTSGSTLDTANRALFGGRSLSTGAHVALNYQYSQRVSVSFGVGVGRTQTIASRGSSDPQFEVAIPHLTSGFARAQLTYALSPRTNIGFAVHGDRAFNRAQDSWATNTRGMFSHTFRRWFFAAYGGAGAITPFRTTYQLKLGPQLSGGGSIGTQGRTQVFLGSVDHSAGDVFGIGGYSTTTAYIVWSWQIPGSTWLMSASGGYQKTASLGSTTTSGWRGGADLQRYLGAGMSMFFGYSNFHAISDFSPFTYRLNAHSVRVGVNWSPMAEWLRQGGDRTGSPVPLGNLPGPRN